MDKETLRMQMLSGIITEGEYAAAINQEVENTEKDSLNEHYVAGGIVGIGAVTQIPSRAKADYEDAFEHFLGQKYEIKEEMEEAKEEVKETRISPDNAVTYLENALGHVWNMGTGKNEIDLQSLAQSIAQDLGLIDDLEEGKEVEEPTNY